MKKLLSISVLFICSIAVFSQEKTTPSVYNHQVGINATAFIKQFLTFNNNITVTNSPYLLTYKHITEGGGLRTGLGLSYSDIIESPASGGVRRAKTNAASIDFRLGFEAQKQLNKRWLFYYGLDALYSYRLLRVQSSVLTPSPFQPNSEIITDRETFGFGAGPVLGVEFKIGKRLSLNTETTAYFVYSEERRRMSNSNFSNFNTNEFSVASGLSIIIPTSLFLVLHF